MEFIEKFPYVIKYKKGSTNITTNALSWRDVLFSKLGAQIVGFENIPKIYEEDSILHPLFLVVNIKHNEDFMFQRGICLKKENFVYLKEQIKNSLLKSRVKEVSWAILELIKLLSF